MLFLLDFEEEFDFITKDSLIIKQLLDNCNEHSYKIMNCRDFYIENSMRLKNKSSFNPEYKYAIPIGSIQFTEAFLRIFYNIKKEEPIEIPKEMQTTYFLKRKYFECSYNELPNKGYFFIKDISHQKQFSFMGNISDIKKKGLRKVHRFLVSEVLEVVSEYRIYVINGTIKNIACYKGDVTVFPDLSFIKSVINEYSKTLNSYNCYSFDIMVSTKGNALIEMHSYLSLGLYSTCWDESILEGYIEGINKLTKKAEG